MSDVIVPLIEHIIGELVLLEHHDPLHPVDLCINPFVHHHISNLLLSHLLADSHQLRQSGQSDSLVVLLDDSDVVLD